ncbi:regulation of nuclear pre-mRNA domain-containing protein 1B-like [Olea europaea var. sylvestris]|uniref:regulation of nuclear pre-mRNA domain-containing protein 1B-like n=1 Tax=Olea europaea var. sylvestris TaxID=158386 RepID=UPI000C1D0434|nr:regulation of nuclear pre-mRNA domain-containing protein 1B-like [Olea europaea var. sylvestris]XP_022894752.1 regulation of nuclear pre-mRNA domain-containing protein 1B-like [Olea europaea var. sylvestris]XP_022894754.1 regulation of nuclear pre-mRNA domain-containing protein 1B-like [Olea europaea var. sylvestris]
MNSVFNEEILADKLSKLNNTQQCIETLSHWCIFHRGKAEQVVATWDKQFHSLEMVKKVHLLYLANDILQNSKRNGNEFVSEFWKVLPSALKEVMKNGDDRGKKAVSRLVNIWEERKVFGSRAQSLKDVMLGEELPPPLEFGKKRSRSVRIKRDSRSIRTKLTIGSTEEKIVSAFNLVLSEHTTEDEEMNKCKSAIQRVRKIGKDVNVALTKAKDPTRRTLAKDLEEEELVLNQCIKKLKVVDANRVMLVSQLREALHEQESELENVRTQMQVAQGQAEEAANMRKCLNEDHVIDSKALIASADTNTKPAQTTRKTAAAIAAEVADKLAASSSSQYIMTSVLSTFAAEEAKNAGLVKSSTSSTSFSSASNTPMSNPVSDQTVFLPAQQPNPSQNNQYQSHMMAQPSIQGQISNSQSMYHSLPKPPSQQYLQPSGGIVASYDYGSLPPLPPGPPPPPPPSYMMNPMVPFTQQPPQMTHQQPLVMGHQPSTLAQQQIGPVPQQPHATPSSLPLPPFQAPGMPYYGHPYQSN